MVEIHQQEALMLSVESQVKGFDVYRLKVWAQELIHQGIYFENILLLARLDTEDKESYLRHFENCLKEMDFVRSLEDRCNAYAQMVALQLGQGEIVPKQALAKMVAMAQSFPNNERFAAFVELQKDLISLREGKATQRDGLFEHNQEAYIMEEFRLFSTMELLQIPLQDRQKMYCQICGNLTHGEQRKKYQVRRPFYYYIQACDCCHSERLKSPYQHFTQRKIIQQYNLQC